MPVHSGQAERLSGRSCTSIPMHKVAEFRPITLRGIPLWPPRITCSTGSSLLFGCFSKRMTWPSNVCCQAGRSAGSPTSADFRALQSCWKITFDLARKYPRRSHTSLCHASGTKFAGHSMERKPHGYLYQEIISATFLVKPQSEAHGSIARCWRLRRGALVLPPKTQAHKKSDRPRYRRQR
jgi:hypothetical protein